MRLDKKNLNNTFLSFIIPVYNGALYLSETIESILSQPCKDFELLLIDDGSKDNSLEICSTYLQDGVYVFSHVNMGVSKTRNRGLSLARGKAIIFVDQDDVVRKDFYTEAMRDAINVNFQQDVDMITCGAWWGNSTLSKGCFRTIEDKKKGVYIGRNNDISWGNSLTFHVNIFSRNLFFDDNGEPTPVRFFDLPLDVETIFRHISQYYSHKILFSDDFSFYVRRNNDESVSSNWDWLKVYPVKCDAYYDLIDWHKSYFPEDLDGIYGAEKQLLSVITEMIEMTYKMNGEVYGIRDYLKGKKYFDDVIRMLKQYPECSDIIETCLQHPDKLSKKNEKSPYSFYRLVRYIYRLFIHKNKSRSLEINLRDTLLN